MSLETEKGKRGTTSKLLITRAQLNDSGNYTCASSKVTPASVMVHVLNGEQNTGGNIGGRRGVGCDGGIAMIHFEILRLAIEQAREKRNVLHCEITPRARFAIRTYICFNSHSQSAPRFPARFPPPPLSLSIHYINMFVIGINNAVCILKY